MIPAARPKATTEVGDHFPILTSRTVLAYKDPVTDRQLTYDAWTSACICGEHYDRGREGWYIPSEYMAQKSYEAHLRRAGVLPPERDTVPADDETEDSWDSKSQDDEAGDSSPRT